MIIAAGTVIIQTSTGSPAALVATSTMRVVNIRADPKIAPWLSTRAALRSSPCAEIDGGIKVVDRNKPHRSTGYTAVAEATTGSTRFAVKAKNEISKPPATTRFVGLDETSTAEAVGRGVSYTCDWTLKLIQPMLHAQNWAKIHAVGGTIPATRVKYARKAVPESMIGSWEDDQAWVAWNSEHRLTLPTITPKVKKKRYKKRYSLGPDDPPLRTTQKARKRSRPVASSAIAIYAYSNNSLE